MSVVVTPCVVCVGIGTGGTGGAAPERSMIPGMNAIGITFDARVSTEEATESLPAPAPPPRTGGGARGSSLAFSGDSSSSSSKSSIHAALRFLIQKRQTRYVTSATTMRPPRMPPIMAPLLRLWLPELEPWGFVAPESCCRTHCR